MFLEIKNLIKSYENGYNILNGLTFSLKKGEVLSFIGDSGSGKSTFLKCLAGLEKINSGKISLNGLTIEDNNYSLPVHKRKIGYVFQDYTLFPHLNVKQNICFNLEKKFSKNFESIVSLCKLKHLLNRYPHEISGGEQQRVCIARSLVREPDLILLDEPFSNLDTRIKEVISNELQNIIKKSKITTILVTHDIHDALHISDKIIVFRDGIIQQFAKPEILYSNPVNEYCASVLGIVNNLLIERKKYILRAEHIKIVEKSKNTLVVDKCIFLGKEYKILGVSNLNNQTICLFSKQKIKLGTIINFEFSTNNLISLK